MTRLLHLLAAIVANCLAACGPSQAADPRYPDWPCVQAKVPEISVAAIWAGPPIDDAEKTWESDARVKELVLRLAPRRVPIEDAQRRIAEFIAGSAAEREQKGKLLFAGLLDRLNRERTEVMDGIERLGHRLRDVAENIRTDISEVQKLQNAANQDQNKLQELLNRVEWNTRIFEDRRKTMRYVCEVPTLIEQRLFALSRAVQQAIE